MVDLITYLAARLDDDDTRLHRINPVRSLAEDSSGVPPSARLVAEVHAKRTIMALHAPVWPDDATAFCRTCGDSDGRDFRAAWPCPTLRALAAPYLNHPHFDPTWLL